MLRGIANLRLQSSSPHRILDRAWRNPLTPSPFFRPALNPIAPRRHTPHVRGNPHPAPDLRKLVAETGEVFRNRRYCIMRRLSVLCAIAGLASTALAAASPAQAAFHVILCHDTGFGQVWDQNLPAAPWPS